MVMFGIVTVGVVRGVPKMFRPPICRAHCAVIFAIAQLSCLYCVLSDSSHSVSAVKRGRQWSVNAMKAWPTVPCNAIKLYTELGLSVMFVLCVHCSGRSFKRQQVEFGVEFRVTRFSIEWNFVTMKEEKSYRKGRFYADNGRHHDEQGWQ